MIPTKRGMSMLVVGVFLYALAWMTHIGWFYVANAVVWAILLVNLLIPSLSVLRLSAQRRVSTKGGGRSVEISEGDTVSVAIDLHNRSLLPGAVVTLDEHCPLAPPGEEEQGFLVGMVAPWGRVTSRYDVRCYRRGVYAFGPIHLRSFAPFGLFRARRTVHAPLEVVVYPMVLPMEANFISGSLQGRALESRPPGPSGEFRGSREYRQGDYLRNVHWRNSARRGQLVVKEFDHIPQGEVRLVFNPELDLGEGRESTLEYAIKIAASLGRRCFQEGRPFRMWPGGQDGVFSTWRGVLEHLARIQTGAQASVWDSLGDRHLPGASVVVVSAANEKMLTLLRQQGAGPGATTVVLLVGFGPGEDLRAGAKLSGTGLTVVPCRRGELPAALASLSKAMVAGGASRTLAPANAGAVSTP